MYGNLEMYSIPTTGLSKFFRNFICTKIILNYMYKNPIFLIHKGKLSECFFTPKKNDV